ncbi:hypothetical protein M758_10G126200 [Ceratodon purpureus]|nr:hypothetical protein M758_10G126200 [Ceratodon purpureus]
MAFKTVQYVKVVFIPFLPVKVMFISIVALLFKRHLILELSLDQVGFVLCPCLHCFEGRSRMTCCHF